jgi:hypothetical protein
VAAVHGGCCRIAIAVTELPTQFPKALVERIRKEREQLRQQIEDSQKTVERSQELLAQLDAMLVKLEGT